MSPHDSPLPCPEGGGGRGEGGGGQAVSQSSNSYHSLAHLGSRLAVLLHEV